MTRSILILSGLVLQVLVLGVTQEPRHPRPIPPTAVATPIPAPPREDRPPALLAKVTGDEPSEPLALAKARYEVTVSGFMAKTTATLTFRNPQARVLEGELVFPLPEGSAIAGYALDIDGELVEGVVVEKEKARISFEQEVRRGIDPGLVEWVKGNNFRTRVWPIPAQGTRTVRVEYLSSLITEGNGGDVTALYHLPLQYQQPIGEFSLKVEVLKSAVRPEIRGGGLANFRLERWEEREVAEHVWRDVTPNQDLVIALPHLPRETVVLEKDRAGQAFFVAEVFPAVVPKSELPRPSRIGVVWDASLSRKGSGLRRDLALLDALLKRLGDVEVALVVFRDRPEKPVTFSVTVGDTHALLEHLTGLPLDGGTGLGQIAFSRDVAWSLLFSDGLGNLGQELPLTPGAPVFTVSGDPQANHAALRFLAERSGGAYFNLATVSDEDVMRGLLAPRLRLLSVECETGQIAEVLPVAGAPVQGRLTLSGKLLTPEARLKLRFGTGGGAPAEERLLVLRQTQDAGGGLAPRFWAQQQVQALSVFPEQNHDSLLALGQSYGLVTPGTSLLVLETVEQYLRHDIAPPESRKEMYAEFQQRRAAQQVTEKTSRESKLARVIEMWERRVAWWERDFAAERLSRPPQKISDADMVRHRGAPRSAGVVGGAPAPPPPAPRVAAAEADAAAPAQARADLRALGYVAPEAKGKAELAGAGEGAGSASIAIKAWDPQTPYLEALRRSAPADAYRTYLASRDEFGQSPAFYLDCADFFFRQQQPELATRILSNVVELRLEDARLLRVAAHRFEQAGVLELAIDLFEKARRLRPEEPQSHRDLALALSLRADALGKEKGTLDVEAKADYRRAIELLQQVVIGEWDGRFPEIEVIALTEANRILAVLERAGVSTADLPIPQKLRKLLDVDLRIVLTWDTDQTDMDLWVVEPSGEKCFYSHGLTTIGGAISRDFTGGYGPEAYEVRKALAGGYAVQANFFGSRSQSLTGPTTVQATVMLNFGRPDESRQTLTLRLTDAREVVDVGKVTFEAKANVR